MFPRSPFSHAEMTALKLITSVIMPLSDVGLACKNIQLICMLCCIKVSGSFEMIHILCDSFHEILAFCFVAAIQHVRNVLQTVGGVQVCQGYKAMNMRTAVLRILDREGERCGKASVAAHKLVG